MSDRRAVPAARSLAHPCGACGGHRGVSALGVLGVVGLLGVLGVAGAGAAPAAAVATSSAAAAASPSPTPSEPRTVALPPITTDVAIAPVVPLTGPVLPVVAPVAELIARTASVDGAVGRDEAPEQEAYTLSGDVFFEPDSAALTPRAEAELATIAASLGDGRPASVEVVGHTDSVDDDAHNQALSEARAAAVQQSLLAQVPGLPVTTQGRGETQPVALEEGSPAEVDRARALNRRVEITATR